MSKSTRKLIQTCKLICTILLVVILGLQFIPYWYGVYTSKTSELLTEEEYFARLAEQNATEATEATDPTEETETPTEDPDPAPTPDPDPTPTPNPTPALPNIDTTEPQGLGNCSENVGVIQEKLVALGYSVGPAGVDTIFGFRTRQAVINFQKDNGLVTDGVVGPETAAAIDAAYAKLDVSVVPGPSEDPVEDPVVDPSEDPVEDPTEEEPTETAPTLNVSYYDVSTAPKDEPVLTRYSIMKFIWLFKVNLKNDVIFMPVLMLIFGVAAIITYCKNTYSVICSVFAVIAPAVGLYGFLTVPLYATGFQNVYILHIIANAIALAFTLFTAILRLVVFIKEVKKDRAERKAKSSFADK